MVSRANLLNFLKEESEQRGVTLIYATHIFDGLENWATDVVFLTNGKIEINSPLKDLAGLQELRQKRVPAPLFRLVEVWLRKVSIRRSRGSSQIPRQRDLCTQSCERMRSKLTR